MQGTDLVHEDLENERISDDVIFDDILWVEELEAFDDGDLVGG